MVASIHELKRLRTLDRAIEITVGVSKGGTGKSWVATNIAATLARKGYYVCLIDANTAANSHNDWCFMANKGQNPGYHCYFDPTPYTSPGGTELSLVEALRPSFDVIVIDTPQYRHVSDIDRAWSGADLLIAPITEDAPDFRFFLSELKSLNALREGKPIAVIPTRCTMLKGQTITRDFGTFLTRLEEAGLLVPRFEKANFHLDYNQRVKSLPVRNIYYKPVQGENCKPVEAWAKKWEAHVEWLVSVLNAEGLALPAARGEIDAIPQFKETVTSEMLKHYGI